VENDDDSSTPSLKRKNIIEELKEVQENYKQD
jgi:hypothetical protein